MISIIIPVFNRKTLVAETLDSILSQTHCDWECIVVDDRSTDGSIDVVAQYVERDSRVRLFIRPESRTKGAASCRNIGYENSRGEFVYFFDSDDLLNPAFLAAVHREMQSYPMAEYATFCYSNFIEVPTIPVRRTRKYDPKRGPLFDQIITNRLQANTPNFFWKRSLFDKVRVLWREELQYGDDTDFVCRMICHADRGVWLDMPDLVYVRRHPDSMGGKGKGEKMKCVEDRVQIFRYIYDYCTQMGRMSSSLHSGYLCHILRIQAINTLLYGDRSVSRYFERLLKALVCRTFGDKRILFFSRCLTLGAPVLRVCADIAILLRIPWLSQRLVLHGVNSMPDKSFGIN